MTHGGPQAADKYSIGSMAYEIQVLAGKGYVSLQPNYRGSTGYGDAFLRDMVGHYFQNAHLDVMAGVDELIRRGIADPDRMVKMGWSAGGHMTNKIITFTDRFKAASTGAGVAQWMSMYAQSDIRSYRTPWFGGTPWQEGCADRRLLEQLAAEGCREREDADVVLRRREGSARADAAVDRDVSRAEEQRRPDAPVCRAARAARLGRAPASARPS